MTIFMQFEDHYVLLNDFYSFEHLSNKHLLKLLCRTPSIAKLDEWLKLNKINAEYSVKFAIRQFNEQFTTNHTIPNRIVYRHNIPIREDSYYRYQVITNNRKEIEVLKGTQSIISVLSLNFHDTNSFLLFKLVWG